MRSFRKLAALSVMLTACASLPGTAHANTSVWDHNGSLMVLEEDGKKRKFVYSEPRSTLSTAGVKKGTVLFDGEEKADGRLSGYAKLFRAGCDPVDYFVEGALDTTKGEMLLQGQAPIYSGEGCKITGYSDDNSASSLVFRPQGGGAYAAREEEPRPDASSSSVRRYEPLDTQRDPEQDRGDTAYDPRYPRDSERDYADRRNLDRPYSRYDRYNRPVYPSEPEDDSYYDEEEEDEPLYAPYRPWRWGN